MDSVELLQAPQSSSVTQERLSARQRIEALLDSGTFEELGALVRHDCRDFGLFEKRPDGDGVITGFGKINGSTVCVYAQDFSIFGGTVSRNHGAKICKIMQLAEKCGAPIIAILDSAGGRIQEGVHALSAYSEIFTQNVRLSGVVPQIGLVLGPCAGGAAYSPSIMDWVVMVNGMSRMFLTGPAVVKSAIGHDVDAATFCDARMHGEKTGSAHVVVDTEQEAISRVRDLVDYYTRPLVQTDLSEAVLEAAQRRLQSLVPAERRQTYSMRDVVECLVDPGSMFEVQADYAKNMVVSLGRIQGRVVGVVANNPRYYAGCIDVRASQKAARFVRMCDAFSIPLLTLVDTPGFLAGLNQELDGILRHGAKLLYAFCEATVPRVCVILRKSFGGAHCVMNPRQTGADYYVAWPQAEIAVMGAEAASEIIWRRDIAESDEPVERKAELVAEYAATHLNPYLAASFGYIDDVIDPADTREKISRAFEMLQDKRAVGVRRKHGNIPI